METRGNLEKLSEGKVHILTRSATVVSVVPTLPLDLILDYTPYSPFVYHFLNLSTVWTALNPSTLRFLWLHTCTTNRLALPSPRYLVMICLALPSPRQG